MAELERLKMKLERGKISRREFLSHVSAMGLAGNWDMDGTKYIEKWWFA